MTVRVVGTELPVGSEVVDTLSDDGGPDTVAFFADAQQGATQQPDDILIG